MTPFAPLKGFMITPNARQDSKRGWFIRPEEPKHMPSVPVVILPLETYTELLAGNDTLNWLLDDDHDGAF